MIYLFFETGAPSHPPCYCTRYSSFAPLPPVENTRGAICTDEVRFPSDPVRFQRAVTVLCNWVYSMPRRWNNLLGSYVHIFERCAATLALSNAPLLARVFVVRVRGFRVCRLNLCDSPTVSMRQVLPQWHTAVRPKSVTERACERVGMPVLPTVCWAPTDENTTRPKPQRIYQT